MPIAWCFAVDKKCLSLGVVLLTRSAYRFMHCRSSVLYYKDHVMGTSRVPAESSSNLRKEGVDVSDLLLQVTVPQGPTLFTDDLITYLHTYIRTVYLHTYAVPTYVLLIYLRVTYVLLTNLLHGDESFLRS